ncbi:MAG: DHHW family protein, partial [Clostridia bacterium]
MKKTINILTIIVFVALILPLTVALILKPADNFSPDERRNLQQFPKFDVDSLMDGSFTSHINTYMNDQFPLRDQFVGIKSVLELSLLRKENNGVLIGKNNQLAVRDFLLSDGEPHPLTYSPPYVDSFFPSLIDSEMTAIKKLAALLSERNIPLSVILPPRTIDVACSAFSYPRDRSDELLKYLKKSLDGVNYIDTAQKFRELYDNGEYVYYKTDHHWTSLGAYYAYVEIMHSLKIAPYPLEDFERDTATADFYGTTYSKGGFKFVPPDKIEFFNHKNMPSTDFSTEVTYIKDKVIKTNKFQSFYDLSYLSDYDKYSTFISGTNLYTRVYKNQSDEPRQKLLLLKDSFANSLVPFLALHFDLELVNLADLNNMTTILPDKILDVDKVLIIYNLENVITADSLTKV